MSANGKKDTTTRAATPVQGAQKVDAPQPATPGGWFTCNVNMTGPAEDGTIYVHLREVNGAFDNWYRAAAAAKKELLATALTAISASLRVSAFLTTKDAYGTLNRLYVVR
jgi:hypothetical protein